ncbi:MAG: Slp family lipoprotein [Gammaproteobacteria bacterium]|nr:Slp family lipoprotein [Gammaproteobacteria bacterium]MBU2058141.1 Slp family lipoprotein [Gammaproteobacteria bacterium]MBU2176048.1 Slp family lipoprotein [Gammaproteobacteria bacterium]MBU2247235.1 Slp family lipoprotein [Gammaproteobacteria bacterium]MBU2342669.1 Slp family lipoprotein [Gammaproteobacteria bacterium]
MSKKFVAVALSLMILAGCASYPEQVRIADNVALTSYENAAQQNVDFGTARWSGVIAQVSNKADKTRLEVVYFPSGTNGRPAVSDQTKGRFVAYIKGFLDPMVYQPGKSVTVLGELSRSETGQVDEYQYRYPVIKDATVYLWPKQEDRVEVIETWPMMRPYPYYWGYGPGIRVRTITKQQSTTQGPVHVDNNKQNKVQP